MSGIFELDTTFVAIGVLELAFVGWLLLRPRRERSGRLVDGAERLGLRARRG
ncbi:MAG: hypothetical protein KC776_14145 [Myxococcales bacterium]|nr:hypothetical protein [Myxococcales bacterium]MCB9579776.1 hypothetical protein [Polyangiaceae bacterium]